MALLMFEIIRYTIFYKKKFDVNDPVALKHKVSFFNPAASNALFSFAGYH